MTNINLNLNEKILNPNVVPRRGDINMFYIVRI
jgi:hypothetical protein